MSAQDYLSTRSAPVECLKLFLLKNKIGPHFLWITVVFQSVMQGRQSYFTKQADILNYWFLTSMVIHQSKAINLNLMKSQFAYSAFHFDIFYIATVLW